jgi:hypothetical protein
VVLHREPQTWAAKESEHPPKPEDFWVEDWADLKDILELMKRIHALKDVRVTGASVAYSFLSATFRCSKGGIPSGTSTAD